MLRACPQGLLFSQKTPSVYLALPQGLLFSPTTKFAYFAYPQGLLFSSKKYLRLKHAPRGFPELLKDLPELTQWAGEDARGGWNRVRVTFSEEMG